MAYALTESLDLEASVDLLNIRLSSSSIIGDVTVFKYIGEIYRNRQ